MSASRPELVRAAIEAWNRADVEAMKQFGLETLEYIPPLAGTIERRKVKGATEFGRFFRSGQDVWDRYRIEVEEIREVEDGAVLLLGRTHARGRRSGASVDRPVATVFWFDGDKVARVEDFGDAEAAIEAVGRRPA